MNRRNVLIAFGWIAILPVAAILSLHRSYSPGPVSAGHVPFVSQCSACHQPWRGVANSGCIDCHGDYEDHNPHKSAKLSGKDDELMPGKLIRAFYSSRDKSDKLSCLSCHTDHRGRNPKLAITAALSCTFCHHHDSIDNVSAHTRKSLQRPTGSRPSFKTAFSHSAEFDLLRQRDHSLRHLPCESCHRLEKTVADQPERFLLIRAGLKLGGAPPTATTAGGLPTAADEYMKLWQSVPAAREAVPIFASLRYINAVFKHSPAHLSYRCGSCHEDIEKKSKRPGDLAAHEVEQCFNCHSRNPPEPTLRASSGTVLSVLGTAIAHAEAVSPKQSEPRYKTCSECHAFHVHGATPDRDLPNRAPIVRPHLADGIWLTMFEKPYPSPSGAAKRPVILQLWLLGLFGLVVSGFGAAAYFRWIPSELAGELAALDTAPQLTPEIPRLDDGYQSSVEGMYIVGETAATASINFAMRSGRQAVEFIEDRLKLQKPGPRPDVYDVAIIGCGPAGIAAATTAKSQGLSYLAIEKSTAVSTIKNYPRGKFVQSTPLSIKEYGEFYMEDDTSKEGLIKKWDEMLAKTKLQILEREEVTGIRRREGLFEVETNSKKTFKSRFVVLAIGVRGSPRRLNLPGETADRVFSILIEPEEYKDRRILVVGGGNAGAEVAQSLANPELRNTVAYSFRDAALGPPVTPENAEKISTLQQKGYLTLYPSSEVREIKPGKVVLAPRASKAGAPKLSSTPGATDAKPSWYSRLRSRLLSSLRGALPTAPAVESRAAATGPLSEPIEIDNDFIFAMLGADLPIKFLKSIGVRMTRKGR